MTITDNDIKKLKTVFATKDDLKNVVKEEVKEQFKDFREELDENLDAKFTQQNEEIDAKFTQQNEEIDAKFTQQRSDFFEKIDPILKETVTNREERIINDDKLANHEDRITKLENQYAHP